MRRPCCNAPLKRACSASAVQTPRPCHPIQRLLFPTLALAFATASNTAVAPAAGSALAPYSQDAMVARMSAASAEQRAKEAAVQAAAATAADQLPLLFSHVGKAGGGTIRLQLKQMGVHHLFSRCHPRPCLHTALRQLAAQQRSLDGILINVRDPVDRFVSAFNWRNAVLCNRTPTDTKRVPVSNRRDKRPSDQPDSYCRTGPTELRERKMIASYSSNANNLAEDLCYTIGKRQEYEEAQDAVGILGHARDSLTAHLGGDAMLAALLAEGATQISAVPLEPGFDFAGLIASAVQGILPADYKQVNLSAVEAAAEDSSTKRIIHKGTAPDVLPPSTAGGTPGTPRLLSEKGTCCLVQHYRADYETILRLADIGCRGPRAALCKAALHSMYNRRHSTCSSLPGSPSGDHGNTEEDEVGTATSTLLFNVGAVMAIFFTGVLPLRCIFLSEQQRSKDADL